MPEPVSSKQQSLDYTPAQDPDDGAVCLAPEDSTAAPPSPALVFETTYGDGEVHLEGIGFRVDPSSTSTARLGSAPNQGTITITGVDALVAATTTNADGSKGARLAGSLNIVQVTVTNSDGSGNELTGGLGLGVGVDVSSGTRDLDGDGRIEQCVRASWGFFVAGACVEPETVVETLSQFATDVSKRLAR